MINRLKLKDVTDVSEFFSELPKVNLFDFYITQNNNRIFLQNDLKLIKKIIKNQECYGKFKHSNLVGIFIIYREKNFRPYLKITAKFLKDVKDLLRFFKWYYFGKEIYCKLNKKNPIISLLQENGFYKIGDRGTEGNEILLVKKTYKTEKFNEYSNIKS